MQAVFNIVTLHNRVTDSRIKSQTVVFHLTCDVIGECEINPDYSQTRHVPVLPDGVCAFKVDLQALTPEMPDTGI